MAAEPNGAHLPQTRLTGAVLLVDDDPGVRATLAAVLQRDGHQVSVARDPEQALTLCQATRPDLILLDLSFQRDGATALVEALRHAAPEALVIVLTDYATLEAALRALSAGAFAYLAKPTDVAELRLAVERGLRQQRLQSELVARMAELETAHAAVARHNAELHQQVTAATSALEAQVAALGAANDQLRQAEEQHTRFVAMVAHELRNPLLLVMNYAQLANRPGVTAADVARYTGLVVEHAQRLSRLVDDLQTATRLSTGHFELQLAECDIAREACRVVEEFQTTITDRQFSCAIAEGVGLVRVDRDRILQALRNLLDNAVKYSVSGGAIEVRVFIEAGRLHVSVRDEGAGIPEADMHRILGAFERGAGSTEVPGSGLGLYITRGIVERHGGELSIRNVSEAGRAGGAIFTLIIPVDQAAPANPGN
ncbi:MAG TPA: hybrid sensor histidine kinase/response regulator [Ktedonobacterales bacterium]|nr:hybrid sensor histidine kinase/response regulator [Ktedonobacterales bacterium]